MPWNMSWSESLKKRVCKYLLQRYLGEYIQDKISFDQLSVDLYNGTATLTDVSLDVDTLNEQGEAYHLPFEFVDGYIESISVSVPWTALFVESSYVEVQGLRITVQPKQRQQNGSMFDSTWSNMTTSLQMAQECLKQDPGPDVEEVIETNTALEMLAQKIEAILYKVKARLLDTVLRIEHVPKDGQIGVAAEIRLKKIDYFDEAGTEEASSQAKHQDVYETAAFSIKKFFVEGFTMYTDEFPCKARTYARSVSSNDSTDSKKSLDTFSTAPVSPELPPQHSELGKGHCLSDTMANVSLGPDPILAGKFLGRQEIKLTLKQNDSVPGPKIDIELSLNSCTYFLTPRQVHVLIELATGLTFPSIEDNSNVAPPRSSRNKPMEAVDFVRVEEELQKQMHPQHIGKSLEHQQGWSSHNLDDSDDDFLPMTTHKMSTSAGSECSAFSEFTVDGKQPSTSTTQTLLNEGSSESTHFKLQISSLNAFLLHDDILTPIAENGGFVAQSSIQQMKNMANDFFLEMGNVMMTKGKDFERNKQKFAEICKRNHLSLSASSLTVEGNEKTLASLRTLMFTLACGSLTLVECLIDEKPLEGNNDRVVPEYCDLLVFDRVDSTNPSLRMKLTHVVQFKGPRSHRLGLPKTEIQISLEPCHAEIDISIVDRISALLNPQSIYRPSQPGPTLCPQTAQACFNQVMDEGDNNVDYKVALKVIAPSVSLNIRFPIPDLRSLHDMDRLPWWKRNVRPDILQLQLTSTIWSTIISSREPNSAIELRWKDANGYYQMSVNEKPVHFLRATADNKGEGEDFNCPRLLLKINPLKPTLLVEEESDDTADSLPLSSIDTLVYQLSLNKKSDPSPFSSRKVVYENQHSQSTDKNEYKDPFSDKDQMVMPGDKAEMALFMETTTSDCRLHFDLNLPNLTLFLPSKDFYEVLYNRINNDIFLWEPTAPKPRPQFDRSNMFISSFDLDSKLSSTKFHAFSPKTSLNSDSNSDEEDHVYYSVYEQRQKQKKLENSRHIGQNKVAVTIASNKSRLTIFTPCKEMVGMQEKNIPGQCGEIHLQIEDGLCYILSGFRGQRDVSFICLQVNRGAVFHTGMQDQPKDYPTLDSISESHVSHLLPTMYHSEPGMYTKLSGLVGIGGDSLDMVSMAIKVNLDPNTNIKTFKVALGIREATIRYRVAPTIQSCVEQFADFFNVSDQFVPGYKEPDIVTELHLHLWSCALDYRPLYLPMRVVITMECLSISSNITAHTSVSLLRFIAEDISLFISKNCNASHVDLKKDYVGVIDIGFCDLSKQYVNFKTQENSPTMSCNVAKELGIPYKDMRASIDSFHIRTCSDSFCALQDLIAYCVSYGDSDANEDNKSETSSEVSRATEESLKYHEEEVHNLMAEAMKEFAMNSSQSSQGGVSSATRRPTSMPMTGEVFLFPDEAGRTSSVEGIAEETSQQTLGDSSALPLPEDDNTDSGDDGFFILEDDPGVGFLPKSGEPEVRVLVSEPIRLIENYFAIPIAKTDQLKAPKSFPLPEERYTLQEMTIVWHLHGGNDFPLPSAQKSKGNKEKHVKILNVSDDHHPCDFSTVGMTYSVSNPNDITWVNTGGSSAKGSPAHQQVKTWKQQGGPGRQLNTVMELQLNKVRFQYEKYPANCEQAVWQILLIQDVEIRDRLASSQINKFLYQYSSEQVPRQTHANMVVIKAVHTRPDPLVSAQECSVKVSILPLRMNIDQDALSFLVSYFSDLSNRCINVQGSDRKSQLQAPVMGVQSPSALSPAEREELLIALDSTQEMVQDLVEPIKDVPVAPATNSPVFFRSFIFSPEVLIRLDYYGKRVDMEQGTLAGLIMGLGHLNCSELKLKRICYRHGLLGIEKLLAFVFSEWLQDIKKNQLPGLLGGVGPMHSLVQLVQGIRDLFWLPVEQYKKDGRIVRGLQRGANSFTTSTAMAVLELTNRLVQTIQCAAETAYDMVSPGPSVKKHRMLKSNRRKRPSQPADLREGMASAYQVVKEGLSDTARVIVNVASEEHRQKGIPGAVGGVLRQIPPTVVKPIIIASEATSNVLGGMQHQLQPDVRREAAEKWR